jgi:hypothetical protein
LFGLTPISRVPPRVVSPTGASTSRRKRVPEVSLSTMKTSVEMPSSTMLRAGLICPESVSDRPLWSL